MNQYLEHLMRESSKPKARLEDGHVRCFNDRYLVVDHGSKAPRMRIDFWQYGLGLYQWRAGVWQPTRFAPDLILLPRVHGLGSDNPFHRLLSQMPADLIPVVERFQWHQYTVMRLLNRNKWALHMAQHNPVLLARLCWEWADHQHWTDEDMDELLLLKREQILGRLCGWNEKWVVRVLAKLDLPTIDESCLGLVRQMLAHPKVPLYLRRFKTITLEMLRCAVRAAKYLDCQLLQRVSHDPNEAGYALQAVASMAYDTIRMGRKTFEPDIEELVMTCTSVGQLRHLHEDVRKDYELMLQAGVASLFGNGDFPFPPFPGNETIIPITTVQELIQEGVEMDHCAASYADMVFLKKVYLYKVLKPQRATLLIVNPFYDPTIGELELAGNGTPSEETWDAVRKWFNSPY